MVKNMMKAVKSRIQLIVDTESNTDRPCVNFSIFIEQWIEYSLTYVLLQGLPAFHLRINSYEKWVFLHILQVPSSSQCSLKTKE